MLMQIRSRAKLAGHENKNGICWMRIDSGEEMKKIKSQLFQPLGQTKGRG
jgi:hypothetical protein